MPRPHFTLRALLVAMLVVASYLAGHFRARNEERTSEEERAEKAVLEEEVRAYQQRELDLDRALRKAVSDMEGLEDRLREYEQRGFKIGE